VQFTVSGLPSGATYTITPQTIAAGAGTTNVTLTVTAPAKTAMQQEGKKLAPFALALLVLPLGFGLRRRKGLVRLAALALLFVGGAAGLTTLAGCSPGSGVFSEAEQNYNITVTATSGSLSHSTTVTLTVQ
jgi:ABC-type spermidine/putrescine transport system permease subunit I